MGVVLPEERYVGVREIDEPMIGNRHAMCVPRQIMQDVFGAAEGPLGVDHSFFAKQGTKKCPERFFTLQRTAGAMKLELLPPKCALEAGDELASKDPTQHSHRQKKARR